jgi:sugar fermentation stimulation protein A
MSDMVREGHRAVMVFLIQRADAKSLSLAEDIDSGYVEAFKAATEAGVEAIALRCRVSPEEIAVEKAVPIRV